ncbi:MAG: nitrate ABC transporter substrate-binding protein [Bradyrhizobiaceae bacterium]|nr:MAG: nitrate ABC transporter substrate-binding protein [Bradyrhizobiaceae bacterium]
MNLKLWAKWIACLFFTFAVAVPHTAKAADYGKPGEPIHLTVAHPCCYAEVWSVFANSGKELWKKYLPPGSTVDYLIGLQGAVVVNQMLAGKADIGYMGDLPAFTATTKTQASDVRIVASTAMSYDQCYVFIVRKDAPEFKDSDEALKWVNGKTVSTPKGSCTDDFVQKLFKRTNTTPESYLNQNIEVISSGFKSGRLDAAAVWEPNASNLVEEGLARRVASGKTIGEQGGGFVVMQADLIKQRPDVVKAWLQAELDAQLWMANPANAKEMIDIVKAKVTGFTDKGLFNAIYGLYPAKDGGNDVRLYLPYTFTPEVMDLVGRGVDFLKANKVINVDKLRDDAIEPSFTQEILKERGLKSPVGLVKAQASN